MCNQRWPATSEKIIIAKRAGERVKRRLPNNSHILKLVTHFTYHVPSHRAARKAKERLVSRGGT